MQEYIDAYNERPHQGIADHSPNEVSDNPDVSKDIVELNTVKSMPIEHSYVVGDLVRRKLKRPTFAKGYKQIWIKRQYTIKSIDGVHAILNDDSRIRLDELQNVLPVDDDEKIDSKVETTEKEAKIEKQLKE